MAESWIRLSATEICFSQFNNKIVENICIDENSWGAFLFETRQNKVSYILTHKTFPCTCRQGQGVMTKNLFPLLVILLEFTVT